MPDRRGDAADRGPADRRGRAPAWVHARRAAGILFGVSDIAVKAISGIGGSDGPLALLNPWTAVALTGTAANVAGIVGGITVFGDSLPGNPVALIAQCTAFALVLVAAWLLPAPVHAAPSAT